MGILLLLIVVIYVLFFSGYFKINSVIVENTSNEELINYFNNYKNKNILLLGSGEIKNDAVQRFPELINLRVIRGLPNTLKIKLEENRPKLIWQTGGKKFYINSDGFAYAEGENILNNPAENLPLVIDKSDIPVQIGKNIIGKNFINFILELDINFATNTGLAISKYEINDTIFQIITVTNNGLNIIFDTTASATEQLGTLSQFLLDHKGEVAEYIDLRVPGKVYYK